MDSYSSKLHQPKKKMRQDYYKRILNGTYNRQTKYIRKNKVRKYKNYKD